MRGLGCTALGLARRNISAGHWLPVIRRIPSGIRAVGLSFDDGPGDKTTLALIDLLRAHDATATFFLTGERAMRAPELLEALVQAGHDVFPHGWQHNHYETAHREVLIDDLDRAEKILNRVRPTPSPYLVRLPYGSGHTSVRVHQALREWKPDAQIAHWDYSTEDHRLADDCRDERELQERCKAAAVRAIRRPGVAGSILLMHEDPYDVSAPFSSRVAAVFVSALLSEMERGGLRGSRIPPLTSSSIICRYIRGWGGGMGARILHREPSHHYQ